MATTPELPARPSRLPAGAASSGMLGAVSGSTPQPSSGVIGAPSGTPAAAVSGSLLSQRASNAWKTARGSITAYRGLTGAISSSFFLEKQAVILDFGRAFTKVGFATESRPRHIIPTPELRCRTRETEGTVRNTYSHDEWVEILDRLLTKVYFHYLSVSAKERRVVVCDAVFSPTPFRSALAFVLYKRFAVPSVAFVIDLVLPLYLTGLSSGIVIDLGYESARVMATFAGVPVVSTHTSASSGGRCIARRLQRRLKAGMPKTQDDDDEPASLAWLDDREGIEDLMVRVCYVACDIPLKSKDGGKDEPSAGSGKLTLRTDAPIVFTPSQGGPVKLPAAYRWQPTEGFFSECPEEGEEQGDLLDSCECYSVPAAFANALEICPTDVRGLVVQNIVVCGGCASFRGLLPRLAVELYEELRRRPKLAALAERLRFVPLDFAPMCAVWTGGAVFGALEGFSDYTADDYSKGKPLPDWAELGHV